MTATYEYLLRDKNVKKIFKECREQKKTEQLIFLCSVERFLFSLAEFQSALNLIRIIACSLLLYTKSMVLSCCLPPKYGMCVKYK